MSNLANFLLIYGASDQYWQEILANALMPLGVLHVVPEEDIQDVLHTRCYSAIFVDASGLHDISALIKRLRLQQLTAAIIVVTASPTWTRARDAFRAGATDYIRKSMDTDEILSAAREASQPKESRCPRIP
jgi:DNA-binding NtrC family response regulator